MKRPLVEIRRNQTFTTSALVARKIGVKHNDFMMTAALVIEKIEKLSHKQLMPKKGASAALVTDELRGELLTPKKCQFGRYWCAEYTETYRGQSFTALRMNREFFSLVIMRFETARAFKWQTAFVDAFFDMETALQARDANRNDKLWLGMRDTGKAARLTMTDAVKAFVEYAKAQGSKNASRYYMLITNATYSALGLPDLKHPDLRDTLDIEALNTVEAAEYMLRRKLSGYMEAGGHYKAIYACLKEDLADFAVALGIEAADRV